MTTTIKVTEDEYRDHADGFDGVCLECGEWSCGGFAPDAESYPCDYCGARTVMGAEQALIFGHLSLAESEDDGYADLGGEAGGE